MGHRAGAWRLAALFLMLPASGCVGGRHALPPAAPPAEPPPCLKPLPAAPLTPGVPSVRTVTDPDARQRRVSLAECVALALEGGRLNDTPVRVLALEPAAAGAAIDQALSRFDPVWQASSIWQTTDEPTGLASQAVLTQQSSTNIQEAHFTSRLLKPLATGGVAGITFQTEYQFSNLNSPVNPSYQPRLTFQFEQPLLQGFGVEMNQIRAGHPGSALTPFVTRGSGVGILLARTAFDRSRARLDAQAQDLLLSVEQAYWRLHLAYWELYSRETGLRLAHRAWQRGVELRRAGEMTVQDLAQLEAQYWLFRSQRLDALGNGQGKPGVLEAERQLRYAIGLPAEDGTRLVPSDTPTSGQLRPCWGEAQAVALARRPELIQARQDVKEAQFRVARAGNDLLPDLRFSGSYDVNSIGGRLDGPDDANALRNLASNRYHNWGIGLRMEVPLGFREANARLRVERLRLEQTLVALRAQEDGIVLSLQRSYRDLIESQERLPLFRARVLSVERQYKALSELYEAGEVADLNVLLSAQRGWVDSIRDEQEALVRYNLAIVDFERQKGTLLDHDNVMIAEGELPAGVQARASEAIRRHAAALVLRERAVPAAPISPPPPSREELPPPALLPRPAVQEAPAPQPTPTPPTPTTARPRVRIISAVGAAGR